MPLIVIKGYPKDEKTKQEVDKTCSISNCKRNIENPCKCLSKECLT